jgi:phenylacetate-CoA ligase
MTVPHGVALRAGAECVTRTVTGLGISLAVDRRMEMSTLLQVMRLRRRLRQRERWSRSDLLRHQEIECHHLRQHAYQRSAFYRRFHRGFEHRPLHELPVLTKDDLMEHFDELVVDPDVRLADIASYLERGASEPYLGRYVVSATSGSTGRRGIFLAGRGEWNTVLASYARANEWAGIAPRLTQPVRMAVLSSRTPWHQSARVGATVQSRLVPTLHLDATDPVPELVARLNEFRPEVLIGYASMLHVLAEEQLSGRLQVHPGAVMSASEVLTPSARQRIEAAWDRPPFNVYAATETAGIAADCERHRMHLFEDLVITEVVDDRNRPVTPGAVGYAVLVTVLYSRTQPLIRYRMSDTIALSRERCPCGRVFGLIDSIEGRREERLILPASGGGTVTLHPVAFHGILDVVPAAAWQVVQDGDAVRVLLERPSPEVNLDALAATVTAALARRGATPSAVRVERVESIARTALGKVLPVRRAAEIADLGDSRAS